MCTLSKGSGFSFTPIWKEGEPGNKANGDHSCWLRIIIIIMDLHYYVHTYLYALMIIGQGDVAEKLIQSRMFRP